MTLVALAIAPGLAICLYILLRDTYNPEPRRYLAVSFLLGALAIVPAALLENGLGYLFGNGILSTAVFAYVVVGFSEECCKFVVLRYYGSTRKAFDEPLDGIVYSVMIGMGFATIENIAYVLEFGYATALVRMFLSVPAHATFAVLMGYHAGKAVTDPARRSLYFFRGLCWAVFFHGTFDFFLFLQGNPKVNPYLSDGLLFIGALASFVVALLLSRKHIRTHRLLSQQNHSQHIV